MIHHFFLRTVVSLLRVYPIEGPGTSVELHILPTHLHSGLREVIGTEEWVELPRGSVFGNQLPGHLALSRTPSGSQKSRLLFPSKKEAV